MINKRKFLLCLIDTLCFLFVYLMVLIVSNVSSSGVVLKDRYYIIHFVSTLFIAMAVRFVLKVYSNIWRYANSRAYLSMVVSDCIATVISVLFTRFTPWNTGIWQTTLVFVGFCLLTLTNRFVYQQIKNRERIDISKNKINA